MVRRILHDHLWHFDLGGEENLRLGDLTGWLSDDALVSHGAHSHVSGLVGVHS